MAFESLELVFRESGAGVPSVCNWLSDSLELVFRESGDIAFRESGAGVLELHSKSLQNHRGGLGPKMSTGGCCSKIPGGGVLKLPEGGILEMPGGVVPNGGGGVPW